MALSTLFILLVGLGLFGAEADDFRQNVTLFDKPNGRGDLTFINEKYIPDLSSARFNNRAVWICMTGTVLLYEERNYNPVGTQLVEFIFRGDQYCANLKSLSEKASSLRFAGEMDDLRKPSFTLYEHTDFQGEEVYITTNASVPSDPWKNHASMIITGNSNWTIFDSPNYKGYWLCLYFSNAKKDFPAPVLIRNLHLLRLHHGNIRSVFRGCPSNSKKFIDLSNYIVH